MWNWVELATTVAMLFEALTNADSYGLQARHELYYFVVLF